VGGLVAVATTGSLLPSISSSSRLSSSIHRDAADFVDVDDDDDDDERDVVDEDDGDGLPPRRGRGGSSFVVLLRDDDDDDDDDDGAIARNAPTEGTTTSTSTSTAAASDSRMVDINRPFFVASPDSAALLTTKERKTPLYSQSGDLVSNFDDAADQTVDFVSLSFGYIK